MPRAVALIVRLASTTLATRPNLSTNTDAIADLNALDVAADADGMASDFMSDSERTNEGTRSQ